MFRSASGLDDRLAASAGVVLVNSLGSGVGGCLDGAEGWPRHCNRGLVTFLYVYAAKGLSGVCASIVGEESKVQNTPPPLDGGWTRMAARWWAQAVATE